MVEQQIGERAAGRFRLIRRIQRLPKPLVIYTAGATGTGKSTLALEIAPLLRIFRITSTDTVRQVMRMVFSPAILPALHRSSFEMGSELPDNVGDDEDRGPLIRAFEEQATRVCVGVRAVVERSIAENQSVVVEGVHLLPSLVPFADLDAVAYQQMVLLTTLDEEVHRSHFFARRTLVARRPDRYIEHFPSIRTQQEHLLELADENEIPLLDTADRDTLVPRALRLLTTALEQQLPWLARASASNADRPVPALLLILDGLPDQPIRALGGRTPLQAANTPALDRLAKEGAVGVADVDRAGRGPGHRGRHPGDLLAVTTGYDAGGPSRLSEPGSSRVLVTSACVATSQQSTTMALLADRRAGRIREGTEELVAVLKRPETAGTPVRQRTGVCSGRHRTSSGHRAAR